METETEHLRSPPPPPDHQQEEGVQEAEALAVADADADADADAGAKAKADGESETAGDGAGNESAAADSGADSDAAAAEGLLTDDLRDKIVRQVEYYFSDENLPTDKFLLKYVKRNKEWFVPIPVIASFRRMKKLVQDISLIEAALRTSSQLVVSVDGKKVTRLHPLPVAEVKDTKEDKKAHTVMVENLPDDYSTDNLQNIFGNVGKIVNITVHDPHSTEQSVTTKKAEMKISNKLHALVEYETVEEAANAVATLNDEKNWRSGMRVEILVKWMGKYVYGHNRRGPKETLSEKNNNQSSETLSDVQRFKYDGFHDEKAETEEDEHHAGGKGKRRGRYNKNQARGQQSANGQGHGHVPSGAANVASKPLPGPKMPNGTRGFTMGRGKPATVQSDPPHV